jgi:DNA-binding MarR family transcriptional regulator
MPKSDFTRNAGPAALGGRLRRLSARIDADAARVYAAVGHPFEQRWFGLLDQLARHGPMSVGELSTALGISHVAISQARQSLESQHLLVSESDNADTRRRNLRLTVQGTSLVKKLTPLWEAFDEAARELDREAGGVVEALDRLEDALKRKSLESRIMDRAAHFPAGRPRKRGLFRADR